MAARLRDTFKPLLLAPGGALCVVAVLLVFFDDDGDFGWALPTLMLLAYLLIVCYVLELLIVLPWLLVWPSARQPHLLTAAAVGMVIAWVLPLVRVLVDGHGFWESFATATVAGGASGLLYAFAVSRTQRGPWSA